MCGICGVLAEEATDALRARAERMTATLVHRGPDAGGVFAAAGVALGHRRLKIIDLSETGAQPMTRGDVTIVYNGETYNFRALRAELEAAGERFAGRSDTEVVLAAYTAWGLEGLARLEGIFAFALWDARRQRLVLARDRLGVKPLYYAQRNGRFAFGSEIKAVLAGAEPERQVDRQALAEYLWYGNAFESRTLFDGVHQVLPGHRVVVEDGRVRETPWWRLEDALETSTGPADLRSAAAAVHDAVHRAVERQLVSDVPVCVFLSGGVDSSAVAAAAARSGGRLTTYAVGFDFEGGVNELPKARRVAEHLRLDHHELQVKGGDLEEVVTALVAAHDEPFADAANIPLYLLAQRLNGEIKVALQGDGGDEMFAGYRRYALLRHAAWWRRFPAWLSTVAQRTGGRTGARIARLADSVGHRDPALRMALLLTVNTLRDPPDALLTAAARERLAEEADPFAAYRAAARRFAEHEPVQRMLLTDLTLQLPSQYLPKVDRATMANGMEARVPLLDEHVQNVALGMPSRFKVTRREKKVALREAMRPHLPADILDGPKTGFGVPYGAWLRGALHAFARDALLDRHFLDRFGLDAARMSETLDAHRSGRRERGFVLWTLLQLSLWSRRYLT